MLHVKWHIKNRKTCFNFSHSTIWILVGSERTKRKQLLKYLNILVHHSPLWKLEERTTVSFKFQTFPNTYLGIHLTKRSKILVSFLLLSNCLGMSSLMETSFFRWWFSMCLALERINLCGVQMLHPSLARGGWSYCTKLLKLLHSHFFKSRKEKKIILKLYGLLNIFYLKHSSAHLVVEFLYKASHLRGFQLKLVLVTLQSTEEGHHLQIYLHPEIPAICLCCPVLLCAPLYFSWPSVKQ